MTMVKVESLREFTREELELKRNELADEQFNLRMRGSLKKLDNPLRLRLIRREIAMILTILREDELNIKSLAKTAKTDLAEAGSKKKTKKK
ncbi:MAG: 50S ribosomal protein L29 [Candidatus Zixiibacteriota bacterium]